MRNALIPFMILSGCNSGPLPVVFPVVLPTVSPAVTADEQRRADIELIVKGQFPAILADIQSGGGPVLTTAFDAAGVPDQDRATRAFQLNNDIGLYADSPGALVTAIALYGAG